MSATDEDEARFEEALKTLRQIDDQLLEWLDHATPADEAAEREKEAIAARRSELKRMRNDLMVEQLLQARQGLTTHMEALNQISAQLAATAKTIETAKMVAGYADTVLRLAAKALA